MVAKFKAIIPKNADQRAVMAALMETMREMGESGAIKDLEATTRTWSGAKPSWKQTVSSSPGQIVLRIEATGSADGIQKWLWLDKGTKPHVIRAKNGGTLAFPGGYQSKTRPGVFPSGSGGAFGDNVYAREVHHPGTDPRGWTEMLVEKYRPKFWDLMRKAMARAAKASGHGR